MYHAYIKEENKFDSRKSLGSFKELDVARERIQKELAKNPDAKYLIEETTGHVDNYGELIAEIIEEN